MFTTLGIMVVSILSGSQALLAQAIPWQEILDFGVLGALITGILVLVEGMRQRRVSRESAENMWWIEFRRQQLSDLYGPLDFERRRSQLLRTLLPISEPNGSRWRLVHHISDTIDDPQMTEIVEHILASNDRMTTLLSRHAGLVESIPAPQAFNDFILHHELLRLSWRTGVNQDKHGSFPFPSADSPSHSTNPCEGDGQTPDTDFDCAVHVGLTSVQNDLDRRLRRQ